MNDKPYVSFGEISRIFLNEQCQYASRYLGRKSYIEKGYPDLGKGLRFKNLNASSYHEIEIHEDDVEEFVRRWREIEDRI